MPWGFIDKTGSWAVEPQFDYLRPLRQGLAIAKRPGDNQLGYVDEEGQWVIEPKFGLCEDFSNNRAKVAMSREEEALAGYVDQSGAMVIEARYKTAGAFSEGLAAVMEDAKVGFIDETGEMVIKATYADAREFNDGLAVVRTRGVNFIDRSAKRVFKKNVTGLTAPDDGVLTYNTGGKSDTSPYLVKGGKWGVINLEGEVLVEPRFTLAREFQGNWAAVQEGGKWGFIDSGGNWLVEPRFDRVHTYDPESANVEIGGKTARLRTDGTLSIEPRFDWFGPFSEGVTMFFVTRGDKRRWGLLAEDGTVVAEPKWSNGFAPADAALWPACQ